MADNFLPKSVPLGDRNWQGGTNFGCQNWSGRTDFGSKSGPGDHFWQVFFAKIGPAGLILGGDRFWRDRTTPCKLSILVAADDGGGDDTGKNDDGTWCYC